MNIVNRHRQLNLVEENIVERLRESNVVLKTTSPSYVEVERLFTVQLERPHYSIPFEKLSYLVKKRFTARQMAEILGVGEWTIQRRIRNFGLSTG